MAPAGNQESSLDHPVLWAELVAPLMADFYCITRRVDRNRLQDCCYGVPRGRICRTPEGYVAWHGEEWPKGVQQSQIRTRIEEVFGFGGAVLPRWAFDPHHRQLDADIATLRQLRCLPDVLPKTRNIPPR